MEWIFEEKNRIERELHKVINYNLEVSHMETVKSNEEEKMLQTDDDSNQPHYLLHYMTFKTSNTTTHTCIVFGDSAKWATSICLK